MNAPVDNAKQAVAAQATVLRKERPNVGREEPLRKKSSPQFQNQPLATTPAAGAHAASHLVNEDATPGAGALPSYSHASGREVDGGAG